MIDLEAFAHLKTWTNLYIVFKWEVYAEVTEGHCLFLFINLKALTYLYIVYTERYFRGSKTLTNIVFDWEVLTSSKIWIYLCIVFDWEVFSEVTEGSDLPLRFHQLKSINLPLHCPQLRGISRVPQDLN